MGKKRISESVIDILSSPEMAEKYLETAGVMLLALDSSGNIALINRKGEEILGRSKDDLICKNWFKICLPKRVQKSVLKIFDDIMAGKLELHKNVEGIVVTKDGEERLIDWHNNVLKDSQGNIIGVLSSGNDITERKQAEEILYKTEGMYRLVIDTMEDSVWLMDMNFVTTFADPSVTYLRGYTLEELKKMPIEKNLTPESLKIAKKRIAEEMTPERLAQKDLDISATLDLEFYRKDGSTKWYEVRISIIRDDEGNPCKMLGVSRDISKRREAEEALRESEKRYRDLVENIEDIMYIFNDKGNLKFFNKATKKYTGYTEEELQGKNLRDLVTPESYEYIEKKFKRQLDGEDVGSFELGFVNKKGEVRFLEARERLVWEGNRVVEVHGIGRDITERKKTEEALNKSEEKFRLAFESATNAIFWANAETGLIINCNKAAETLLEKKKEEIIGQHQTTLHPPLEAEYYTNMFKRHIEQKGTVDDYANVLTKSGKTIPIHIVAFVASIGEDVIMQGIFHDITERKKAEETLKESEEKFRNLFENSIDAVYTVDIEGNLTNANNALEILSGYKKSELIGKKFKEFTKPEVAEQIYKEYNHLFRSGEPIRNLITTMFAKSGEEKIVEMYVNVVREGNKIIGFQGTLRDITDRKSLEEQLIHIQKMEALGSLAGGIAHNFNNILVGIMGYSELLVTKKNKDDPDYKALKIIHESTLRASKLTHELLNIARGGEFRRMRVNLNNVVEKVLPLLSGSFDKSIDIKTYLANNLMMIEGDAGHIDQCILNLCINARDAMPKGGELIIETNNQRLDRDFVNTHLDAQEGDYVVLSVTDTGIGMSHEVKEHIFEPFFSTKEEKSGTGMGLSTVYGIVKNHGGLITVYSEEGVGSTFKLYFPGVRRKLKETPTREDNEKYAGSATILLVDDEQVVIDTWSEFLLQQGHQVLTAQDGEKALKIFQNKKDKIDLVILDYIMPKMGGKEVLIRLKEIDPDVKILVASGYSENGQAKEIIAEGADGFIQKPSQLNELHRKIIEILQYTK